jgi:FixJ family two-component response regulator
MKRTATSLEERPTAYVVDDDDAVRDSIRMLLESQGFTVCTYASGWSFLREARANRNSCLVVDVNMPGMNGLELLDQLRRDGIMVPAIVVTGRFDTGILATVDRAGAAVLLAKPFRVGELVGCIERALAQVRD